MQGMKKMCLPLLIAALLAGCGGKKDETATEETPAAQVAAKVNGTDLTVDQVNYALQRLPSLDKEKRKVASLQVVRKLVDQEVLAQKALTDKLDRDPMVVQALDAARRQILADAYVSRKLGAPGEPTDAEVSDYFDKHPELFAKRKIYRLQELSIKAPQDKHDAIRAQLAASKNLNDFAAWLKKENYPTKAGQTVKAAEQLPMEMLSQLAQMPDGQAMVANAPEGLLVVVLADSVVQPVTLEQAKPAIARVLQTQARQKAAKAELDALKAAAKIEYLGEFAEAGEEKAAKPAESSVAPADASAPNADAEASSKGVSDLK